MSNTSCHFSQRNQIRSALSWTKLSGKSIALGQKFFGGNIFLE